MSLSFLASLSGKKNHVMHRSRELFYSWWVDRFARTARYSIKKNHGSVCSQRAVRSV